MSARDRCKLLGDDLASMTGPIELGEFCACLVSCQMTGRTIRLLETTVKCWETIWPAQLALLYWVSFVLVWFPVV